ncbi:UNVERIFIED_CONTAM: hypothetical protein K2H54_059004 [Gekko kuhli]
MFAHMSCDRKRQGPPPVASGAGGSSRRTTDLPGNYGLRDPGLIHSVPFPFCSVVEFQMCPVVCWQLSPALPHASGCVDAVMCVLACPQIVQRHPGCDFCVCVFSWATLQGSALGKICSWIAEVQSADKLCCLLTSFTLSCP